MALQKQTKQFIFSKGVDSHIAPEVLPVGQLHSAENVRIPQMGKFAKSYGSTEFTTTKLITDNDSAGGSLAGARAFFTNQSGLYNCSPHTAPHTPDTQGANVAPDDIYSYSTTANKWAYMCRGASITATSAPVPPGLNASFGGYLEEFTSSADAVSLGGYTFVCTNANPQFGHTVLNIFDSSTGATVFTISLGGLYFGRPVIFSATRVIVVGYAQAASIVGYNFDTSALTGVLPTAITFVTDTSAFPLLDCFVAPINGNFYLTYTNNVGSIGVYRYSSIVTSGTATAVAFINIAENTTKCLTIFGGESTYQKIYVAYAKAGTGLRVNICSLTLSGSSLITAYGYEPLSVCGAGAPITVGFFGEPVILFGQFESSAEDNYLNITYFTCNASAVTRNSTFYNYGMYLGSKPALINNIWHVLLISSVTSERTYYLAYLPQASNGNAYTLLPIAKLLFGQAGPPQPVETPIRRFVLPQLTALSSNVYITAGSKRAGGSNEFPQYVAQVLTFNCTTDNPNSYLFREIAGLTYFTGGFPTAFDGRQLFEAAFLASPLTPITATASAGGSLTAGTYSFCVVHEFTDALGGLHQSAPSVPVSIVVTGGQKVTFKAFAPVMTLHQNLNIAVYRTLANEEVYHLENYIDVSGATGFSPGKQYTGTLTNSDTVVDAEPLLYTEGDVVENQCPTATSAITIWGDRIWCLTDDGVVFSKVITDGFPAAWNPVFNINTLVNQGRPTAIAAQRDKLLVFYRENAYYTTGDGPGDTGEGSFTKLELASSGIGCISAPSVVEAVDQVFFQSRDGYRTITQSLEVAYMGSELDNWISESTVITSASFFDSLHEVRIMDGTRTYVYDTKYKTWMTRASGDYRGIVWTPIGSSKRYVHIAGSTMYGGTMYYENPATYQYPTSTYPSITLRTGWITMDQFLGFERLYKVILLGRYYTAHTLTLKVFYDYTPQVIETHTFASSAGGFAAFTDANIYENDSYAGNGYPYEVQFKPSVQKCQAIRIEITDTSSTGTGQALEVIGLNFILGVKTADGKIRDAATGTGSGRPSFIP